MRILAWLFLTLILCPAVSAALPSEFSVEAATLEGEGTVYGDLAVFHLEGNPRQLGSSETNLFSVLHLQGQHIAVETGHNARNMSAAGAAITPAYAWSSTQEFQDAQITTTRVGDSYDLLAASVEGSTAAVALQSSLLHLAAGDDDTISHESMLIKDTREPITTEVGRSHEVSASADGDLRIQGDFVLVLWDVDLRVATSDGDHDLWSGVSSEYYLASQNGAPRKVEEREMHLTVHNGSLELTGAGSWTHAYLDGHDASAVGSIQLEGAVPLSANPQAPRDRAFAGPIGVGLSPVADGQFRVGSPQGSAAAALFDGDLSSDGTLAPGPGAAGDWTWLAWVLPLVAAGAAGTFWEIRRRRQDHEMARLVNAMDEAEYRLVADQAMPLLGVRRFASEVVVMACVSLLRLGRDQEVLDLLEQTPEKRRPRHAACAYLQACALAQMHRIDEARDKVERCLQIDPSFSVEIMNNPTVAALLGKTSASDGAVGAGYA